MADRSLLARLLAGGEEEDAPPRRRGLFDARIDPRVNANLSSDFSHGLSGGVQQAAGDFQGGFDGAALNARQGLPLPLVEALSQSGIPGWGDLSRARNSADAATFQSNSFADATRAGLDAPSAPISPGPSMPLADAAAIPGRIGQERNDAMVGGRSGRAPPDATFTLAPEAMPFRNPLTHEAHYRSRLANSYGGHQRTTEPTFDAIPDYPEALQRPIDRRTPAPYSMEDEAWQAAQERSRAAIEATHGARDTGPARLPRPGQPLIAQAWADGRRGRRGRTGGGGW